jgi:hypothetical protein
MARPRAGEPKNKEVLVRLTRGEYEVLTAVAHLEQITVNALVRRLVEREVARMAADPQVVADIKNRSAYQAKKGGTVLPMSDARPSDG